jgi:hypothetical protein
MTDYVVSEDFLETLYDLIDTAVLTSEVNFEDPTVDYEIAKRLVIEQTIPLIVDIFDSKVLNQNEQLMSYIVALSQVVLENFYLNVENIHLKNKLTTK